MIKKHIVLIGILLSILLLTIAAFYYPGGSQKDLNTTGYDWENNYLCNLFNQKAMNGMDSSSRPWAVSGMLLLCLSFAIFFSRFSNKINPGSAARIIKYSGIASMLFAFLIVTPYHDIMIPVFSVFALIPLLLIAIFIFRSKLTFLKLLSIILGVMLWFNNYMYYANTWMEFLPLLQKFTFLLVIGWILGLEYFAKQEDFQLTFSGTTKS